MLTRTRSTLASVVLLGLVLGAAGCGSGEKKASDDKSAKPSPSASESPTSYLEVPEGVTLTEPGTQLALGEEGVVAFERRQKEVGTIAVTIERIERTSFRASFPNWEVDDMTAARTPYFVRLTVTNVGDTDLGGLQLDNVIWADDGATLEAPNYYTKKQQPACVGGPLPEEFANGATAELCQIYYIAPERTLQSISFIPPAGLDAVTWVGEISKVTKPGKKKPKKSDEKKPAQEES